MGDPQTSGEIPSARNTAKLTTPLADIADSLGYSDVSDSTSDAVAAGNTTGDTTGNVPTPAPIFPMTSSPLTQQKSAPTRDAADSLLAASVARYERTLDANDMLYAFDASRNYDPWPKLESITAPIAWVNSADDFINPPDYGIAEEAARRMKTGRYILVHATSDTRGHGTHTWAKFWRQELIDLLARS